MAFDFSYPNTPPNERGWGPGWPQCQTDKAVTLRVAGTVFVGGIREELAELAERLVLESLKRGYIPRLDDPGCWGGACRATKRADGSFTTTPSNHSWYTALDINAPHNVYGSDQHQIPNKMAELFKDYGWRWLGPPIKDWMHFDFAGTPADARRMLKKAREKHLGEEEDDVAYAEYKEGMKARLAGDPIRDGWSSDKKFGWRAEDRTQRALVEPAAGTPGAHDHDGAYAPATHGHDVTGTAA